MEPRGLMKLEASVLAAGGLASAPTGRGDGMQPLVLQAGGMEPLPPPGRGGWTASLRAPAAARDGKEVASCPRRTPRIRFRSCFHFSLSRLGQG